MKTAITVKYSGRGNVDIDCPVCGLGCIVDPGVAVRLVAEFAERHAVCSEKMRPEQRLLLTFLRHALEDDEGISQMAHSDLLVWYDCQVASNTGDDIEKWSEFDRELARLMQSIDATDGRFYVIPRLESA